MKDVVLPFELKDKKTLRSDEQEEREWQEKDLPAITQTT